MNVGKYCSGEQRELMGKILIAEDDQNQADAIADVLKREFHTLEVVSDGAEAMDRLRLYHYDLAILDWEMPKYTGLQVLQQFRKNGGQVPVLMLTGMSSVNNKVDGLDSGADDYLTKPFSGAELSARVRALLRRPNETRSSALTLGNLTFDCNKTRLTIDDKEIVLSPLEKKFIEYLLNHANEVVTQETLLDRVWSSESDASSAAIYTCIKAMRKKLQGDANTPVISTVYGMGYRLELKK